MLNLRQILDNKVNGATFISLNTITKVKLLGGKKNPLQDRVAKKVTNSNVIIFQNKNSNGYANMVERRLIQEGKDPSSFELQPRAWGVREQGTPFVTYNGKEYLEVIFLKCGEVKYLVDDVETDPNTIEGLDRSPKQEGEQGGLDNKVIIRTYAVDSVRSITVDHEHYC